MPKKVEKTISGAKVKKPVLLDNNRFVNIEEETLPEVKFYLDGVLTDTIPQEVIQKDLGESNLVELQERINSYSADRQALSDKWDADKSAALAAFDADHIDRVALKDALDAL